MSNERHFTGVTSLKSNLNQKQETNLARRGEKRKKKHASKNKDRKQLENIEINEQRGVSTTKR